MVYGKIEMKYCEVIILRYLRILKQFRLGLVFATALLLLLAPAMAIHEPFHLPPYSRLTEAYLCVLADKIQSVINHNEKDSS